MKIKPNSCIERALNANFECIHFWTNELGDREKSWSETEWVRARECQWEIENVLQKAVESLVAFCLPRAVCTALLLNGRLAYIVVFPLSCRSKTGKLYIVSDSNAHWKFFHWFSNHRNVSALTFSKIQPKTHTHTAHKNQNQATPKWKCSVCLSAKVEGNGVVACARTHATHNNNKAGKWKQIK